MAGGAQDAAGTLQNAAETISALASLAWPVIVGLLVWKLLPFVKAIIESRAFSIKVAGMEISVQDATDQLRTQIEDLQRQVLALRTGEGPAAESDQPAGATSRSLASEPAAGGAVLWVDDHPSANAFEIAQLQSMGVPVIKAQTTAEAMEAIGRHAGIRAIISDMGRQEGGTYHGRAGIELLTALRHAGVDAPYVIYTTAKYAKQRDDEVKAAGGDGAISSQVELLGWLRRTVGGADA